MTKLLNILKGVALLGAVLTLAISAVPYSANAQLDQDPVTCRSTGTECQIIFPDDSVGYYALVK